MKSRGQTVWKAFLIFLKLWMDVSAPGSIESFRSCQKTLVVVALLKYISFNNLSRSPLLNSFFFIRIRLYNLGITPFHTACTELFSFRCLRNLNAMIEFDKIKAKPMNHYSCKLRHSKPLVILLHFLHALCIIFVLSGKFYSSERFKNVFFTFH